LRACNDFIYFVADDASLWVPTERDDFKKHSFKQLELFMRTRLELITVFTNSLSSRYPGPLASVREAVKQAHFNLLVYEAMGTFDAQLKESLMLRLNAIESLLPPEKQDG
jgi:hypothetical protein